MGPTAPVNVVKGQRLSFGGGRGDGGGGVSQSKSRPDRGRLLDHELWKGGPSGKAACAQARKTYMCCSYLPDESLSANPSRY